jgi:hypothetical protein
MSEHVRRIDSFQTKLSHSRFAEAIAKERWECAREELKALNDQRCCAECVQLRRFGRALTSVEAELDTANNSTSHKSRPSGDGGPDNDGMDAPNVNDTLVDVDDVDTNADDANIDNDELTQE